MKRLFSSGETDVRLPAFPYTPPVGWTMRATPSVVYCDTVVPAETIEAVGKYVAKSKQGDDAISPR